MRMPLAAAAGGGFEYHRVADAIGHRQSVAHRSDGTCGTGNHRHAGLLDGFFGRGLVAHLADGEGVGADKLEIHGSAGFGEQRVFREETVARVDGIRVDGQGRGQDVLVIQVALAGRRRADAEGLVGVADEQGFAVGGGVDGHGLDAQLLGGADHAHGDFAAVGHQQFGNHETQGPGSMRKST